MGDSLCILNCFSITLQKVNPKSRTMPFTPEELYKFQQLSTAGKDAEIAEKNAEIAGLRVELYNKNEEIERLKTRIEAMEVMQKLNADEMTRKAAKMEGMKEFLEKMINYAENLTAEENNEAKAIWECIKSWVFDKDIPVGFMDDELRRRVNSLGKKEKGISMSADSFIRVSGNENVNIGN